MQAHARTQPAPALSGTAAEDAASAVLCVAALELLVEVPQERPPRQDLSVRVSYAPKTPATCGSVRLGRHELRPHAQRDDAQTRVRCRRLSAASGGCVVSRGGCCCRAGGVVHQECGDYGLLGPSVIERSAALAVGRDGQRRDGIGERARTFAILLRQPQRGSSVAAVSSTLRARRRPAHAALALRHADRLADADGQLRRDQWRPREARRRLGGALGRLLPRRRRDGPRRAPPPHHARDGRAAGAGLALLRQPAAQLHAVVDLQLGLGVRERRRRCRGLLLGRGRRAVRSRAVGITVGNSAERGQLEADLHRRGATAAAAAAAARVLGDVAEVQVLAEVPDVDHAAGEPVWRHDSAAARTR